MKGESGRELAVVGGHDEQGPVPFPALLQALDQPAERAVLKSHALVVEIPGEIDQTVLAGDLLVSFKKATGGPQLSRGRDGPRRSPPKLPGPMDVGRLDMGPVEHAGASLPKPPELPMQEDGRGDQRRAAGVLHHVDAPVEPADPAAVGIGRQDLGRVSGLAHPLGHGDRLRRGAGRFADCDRRRGRCCGARS